MGGEGKGEIKEEIMNGSTFISFTYSIG